VSEQEETTAVNETPTGNTPEKRATLARQQGLGVAWGLVNGIIFTLGLWLALAGLVLLIVRRI
jgi:hypothetical protein